MNLRMNGFSLWCDFIERNFLDKKFGELIRKGVIYGATSNPSIFANAILKSNAYTKDKENLKGKNAKEIYENLAFTDIKIAATKLLPLWKQDRDDGYISIEIDPNLCDNAAKSIDEGKRIFATLGMPNVMIKVPATNAGFEVMNELYKSGINVNATLIFSTKQVQSCLESFGKNSSNNAPKAVISVFVSRFDRMLESLHQTKDSAPKLGIYNALYCYDMIERFGNPHIRTLFASTGVKDDFIPADYYIKNLLFKHSINTAPLESIEAFMRQDIVSMSELKMTAEIEKYLQSFDLDTINQQLLCDGLKIFVKSFEEMLQAI